MIQKFLSDNNIHMFAVQSVEVIKHIWMGQSNSYYEYGINWLWVPLIF